MWAFFWKKKTVVKRAIAEWRKWRVLRRDGNWDETGNLQNAGKVESQKWWLQDSGSKMKG